MSVMHTYARVLLPAGLISIISLASCSDPQSQAPTPPAADRVSPPGQGRESALERFPEMPSELPATRIRSVGDEAPPELTDAELVEAVTRSGGEVFIGLKPATSLRTRETGVVPGIDRATAHAGRRAIEALGAIITLTYRYTSAVAATIQPEAAPKLRRLGVVDYVEARSPGRVQAQDTSWGVKKIQAQFVWTGGGWFPPTRGEGVAITILDTGLDEMHLTSGDGPAGVGAEGCLYVLAAGGSSCFDPQTNLYNRGHGARVAGIIAARDNDLGYIGIANNVSQFESIRACNSAGWCDPAWVVAGLDWVRFMHASRPRQVVNMSIGYCQDFTPLAHAVALASDAGILLVGAAGNRVKNADYVFYCGSQTNHLPDGLYSVMFPARYGAVMAVSGTTRNDEFAFAPPDDSGGGGSPPLP